LTFEVLYEDAVSTEMPYYLENISIPFGNKNLTHLYYSQLYFFSHKIVGVYVSPWIHRC